MSPFFLNGEKPTSATEWLMAASPLRKKGDIKGLQKRTLLQRHPMGGKRTTKTAVNKPVTAEGQNVKNPYIYFLSFDLGQKTGSSEAAESGTAL